MSRFAPSPTGLLHIGNARVALLNYILSCQKNQVLKLRIDDTDRERSKLEYIDIIREDLDWLGIKYQYTYKQSERDYSAEIELLKKENLIYPCYETPEELEAQRKHQNSQRSPPRYIPCASDFSRQPHWRFKLTQQNETWTDGVIGEQLHFAGEYSDPVVIKEDGTILYNLASIIDDCRDNIPWILRGQDHVSNTVVQIQMLRSLDKQRQIQWFHIPLMQEKGQKLSKRISNEYSIQFLKHQGYDALALIYTLLNTGKSTPLKVSDAIKVIWKSTDAPDKKRDRTIDAIISNFDFKYSSARSEWYIENCYKWQLHINQHKSPSEGTSWLARNGWADATANHWELIKDIMGNKDDAIYWQSVFTDPLFYVKVQNQDEEIIRKCALENCDINVIADKLPQFSKKEIGQAIHQALTGKVFGPKILDLIKVLPADFIQKRLN